MTWPMVEPPSMTMDMGASASGRNWGVYGGGEDVEEDELPMGRATIKRRSQAIVDGGSHQREGMDGGLGIENLQVANRHPNHQARQPPSSQALLTPQQLPPPTYPLQQQQQQQHQHLAPPSIFSHNQRIGGGTLQQQQQQHLPSSSVGGWKGSGGDPPLAHFGGGMERKGGGAGNWNLTPDMMNQPWGARVSDEVLGVQALPLASSLTCPSPRPFAGTVLRTLNAK